MHRSIKLTNYLCFGLLISSYFKSYHWRIQKGTTDTHPLPLGPIFTADKQSLGQGNVFTRVCYSVHRGKGPLYDVTPCLAAWSHAPSRGVSVSGPMFLPTGLCLKNLSNRDHPDRYPFWTETLVW